MAIPKFFRIFISSSKQRFLWFIGLSVTAAGFLVLISMFMYNSSGAAQLDLSRPGYVSVRSRTVSNDAEVQNYSSIGQINQDTINEFKIIFHKQSIKIKSVDVFGGDPLSPEALGINGGDN